MLKFRWGLVPEEMKFAAAPPGIKFALGENVKQSNWGDTFQHPLSRKPAWASSNWCATRSSAAIEYRQAHGTTGTAARPACRRASISSWKLWPKCVAGKRLIHCHAYRQDEILALLRTCDVVRRADRDVAAYSRRLQGGRRDGQARRRRVELLGLVGLTSSKSYDAIPYNGALLHDAGVVVSFNSDDAELGAAIEPGSGQGHEIWRRADAESSEVRHAQSRPSNWASTSGSVRSKRAKTPTWSSGIARRFDVHPLRADLGRWPALLHRAADDAVLRKEMTDHRTKLIQRVLASGDPTEDPDDIKKEVWPREDIFCFHGDEE